MKDLNAGHIFLTPKLNAIHSLTLHQHTTSITNSGTSADAIPSFFILFFCLLKSSTAWIRGIGPSLEVVKFPC